MNWGATLDTDPVAQHFESLGYEVTWDGKSGGARWYEVHKDGELFVQIDMGISLAHLQQDFADHLAGREGSSPSGDYIISGPDSAELTEFMQAVVGER